MHSTNELQTLLRLISEIFQKFILDNHCTAVNLESNSHFSKSKQQNKNILLYIYIKFCTRYIHMACEIL